MTRHVSNLSIAFDMTLVVKKSYRHYVLAPQHTQSIFNWPLRRTDSPSAKGFATKTWSEEIDGGVLTSHKTEVGPFSTWRAPSSPHLACGLNVSFFLRTCARPNPAKAGGCARECWVEKACGTLHRGCDSGEDWMLCSYREGGGLRKSNFGNCIELSVWRPRIPWVWELQREV